MATVKSKAAIHTALSVIAFLTTTLSSALYLYRMWWNRNASNTEESLVGGPLMLLTIFLLPVWAFKAWHVVATRWSELIRKNKDLKRTALVVMLTGAGILWGLGELMLFEIPAAEGFLGPAVQNLFPVELTAVNFACTLVALSTTLMTLLYKDNVDPVSLG